MVSYLASLVSQTLFTVTTVVLVLTVVNMVTALVDTMVMEVVTASRQHGWAIIAMNVPPVTTGQHVSHAPASRPIILLQPAATEEHAMKRCWAMERVLATMDTWVMHARLVTLMLVSFGRHGRPWTA